ncbi:creatininase family protein [Microaceticoccus formicicus]|uniref:creatininase family protein n=1 Tax=Microaceticoccus formicicus TaxID=3118105 RepID=UPI003CD02D32|nr:creatininase family protein [Peptoniphilaceae bacterium AMB_02]
MKLSHLSWKQAENIFKRVDIAILPVGSVENHGTHGPLGTDYLIPERLSEMIEKETEVIVLPVIPYGVCPHHKSFPGTINIGHDALQMVVRNIVFSLFEQGIKKFVFLNGHGGNDSSLDMVALELYNRGGIAATVDWWVLAGQLNNEWVGGHAGREEASAIMAIDEDLIDLNEVVPLDYKNLTDELKCLNINTVEFKGASIKIMRDVRDVVESGWFGKDDPAFATKEEGESMLNATAKYLVDFIEEFKKIKLDR